MIKNIKFGLRFSNAFIVIKTLMSIRIHEF
jgi:hypothetical protein